MTERLLGWLIVLLRRTWITTVLLATLVSVLLVSFQQANWVQDEAALSNAFLVGLGFGLLLAHARFRGWFIGAYALIISTLIAIEAVGRVLPSFGMLINSTWNEVLEQMNLRIFNVSLRIADWFETLRAGENIEDPGLFVMLLSAVLALCAIWLMWSLIHSRNVLVGLLPIGLLYAVNVHLSRQDLTNFMVFLFCALLLIARSEFNRQHEEWDRRRVDYPDQLGLEWGGAALAFALVIVLAARAAPLFGTPEGWRAISEWVNRANDQTSETATRLFSGVNPPPPDPNAKQEVFVNTPNMGMIGAPISQGLQTVMWVSISDPAPPPQDFGMSGPAVPVRVHYWRNGIHGAYNGRGWDTVQAGDEIIRQSDEALEDAPVGRYYLRQTFVLEARHKGTLFSVNDPVQTSREVYLREAGTREGWVVEGQASDYSVISSATRISANLLATASQEYPEEIRARYLQIPDTLPARVGALAERVVEGARNPYERTLRIQNYLRENYQYDLTVREAPENRDVVDFFLFEDPRGFCSHYASSMVVMLRSVGVPARVVTGYAMGEYDQERQSYRVPEAAAHAWVEAYFHGYGWIEFEPTVVRSAIVYSEEFIPESDGSAPVSLNPEPLTGQPAFIALVIATALALIALPFLLIRMFTTSRLRPAVQVDVLYRRMRRALGWAGFAAVGSVTPDEYLRLYSDRLAPYGQIQQALHQATALYREAVYSPHQPDARRVRLVSLLWQNSFRQWLVLLFRTNWKKLRSRWTV